MSDSQPVIVVRRKKVVAAHGHSSAWKIAFADFAVAMMAFFLVLWLTESTSLEEQKAISGYFTDPVGFEEGGQKYIIDLGGSGDKILGKADEVERATVEEAKSVIDAETVQALAAEIENQQFQELAEEIREVIKTTEALKPLEEQVQLSVTKEGLQIQILDQEFRPMFDSGSDEIKEHASDILSTLGQTIAKLPNRISIAGHTDASGFAGRRDYSNWELSSERANAARRVLQRNGVREDQVTRVVGKGSSSLYLPEEPLNPINRRISILVLSKQSEEDLKEQFEGLQGPGIDMGNVTDDPELNHTEKTETPSEISEDLVDGVSEGEDGESGITDGADEFDFTSELEEQGLEDNGLDGAAVDVGEGEAAEQLGSEPGSADADVFSFDDAQVTTPEPSAPLSSDTFSFESNAEEAEGQGAVSTATSENDAGSSATGGSASEAFDFDFDSTGSEVDSADAPEAQASQPREASAPEEIPGRASPQPLEDLQPTEADLPVIVEPEETPWWEQ